MALRFSHVPEQTIAGYQDVLKETFTHRYDIRSDVWSNENALRAPAHELVKRISGGNRKTVLDIGVGRGVDAEVIISAGHDVVGLDIIEISDWKDLLSRYGARLTLKVGAFPEWADGLDTQFDGILDNGCLHHQHPDIYAKYIQRVVELLKDGGVYALTVFTQNGPDALGGDVKFLDGGRIVRYFTEVELREFFITSGLTPVAVFNIVRPGGRPECLVGLGVKVGKT